MSFEKAKVTKVNIDGILFDNRYLLYSEHEQDCCEHHELDFESLDLEEFEGLEFNLSSDFYKKIEDFGIELVPLKGWGVKVAGHGYNNGYYSSDLNFVIVDTLEDKELINVDISECQCIDWH